MTASEKTPLISLPPAAPGGETGIRGRVNEGKSYIPAFELGKPLDGGAVGEVVESRAGQWKNVGKMIVALAPTTR